MHLFALFFVLALAPVASAHQFQTEEPAKPPKGFVTKDEQPQRSEPVEIEEDDMARYEGVFAKLVAAFENEDVEAYEALMTTRLLEKHRQANDPLSFLLEFMSGVMAKRGDFAGFHELSHKAQSIPDTEYPILPAIFHLEDGTPGYIAIALSVDDKIDHLSLIVKDGICPNGSGCELATHEFMIEHDE